MLTIGICDDTIQVTEEVESLLLKISTECNIPITIDIFYDGHSLVNYVRKNNNYDILYLDIEMEKKNGIDAAREIREFDSHVIIIYITSHESFAKDAFEVSAFRFLTKPIDYNKFYEYFIAAQKLALQSSKYFFYQYNKSSYKLPIDKIVYFQSEKRRIYIITEEEEYMFYGKLNAIEKYLDTETLPFYRVHQSFLVNHKYVKIFMYDSIILMDGTVIGISEKRRKDVAALFCKLKADSIIK